MNIAHLQRFSLIDYPGGICAVLFTRGCTFRCPWCHNPELIDSRPETNDPTPGSVLSFLETRKEKIDALTITGGEPMLQGKALLSFAEAIKQMGFLLKVDTNGSHPEILEQLLEEKLLDYVAMDIKGPLDRYETVAGVPINAHSIRQSIKTVMNRAPDYEFRTTVIPSLLSPDALEETAAPIEGARRYYLQKMERKKILDPAFAGKKEYGRDDMLQILPRIRRLVPAAEIRGW